MKERNGVAEAVQVQLRKGVLELCVLALLSQRDAYGYEIASRLAGGIGMGEGTVYPLMRRMQAEGLVATYHVESDQGPSRKYYRLTPAGSARFIAQKSEWTAFSEAVDALLGEVA
jgi:PadR family transcriptional regulator PadR